MRERVAVRFEAFYPEPLNLWVEVNAQPSSDGIVLYFQDVTGRRKQEQDRERLIEVERTAHREAEAAREQLAHQAITDDLTGLPNRRRFTQQLEQALTVGEPLAVLLLDLNRFKDVNDSLGHHLGDELLRLVGPRLADQLGAGDLLARLGGDEFGLLLHGADDDEQALLVAERVRAALQEPFRVGGVSLHIDASLGVALAGRDGSAADTLLHAADTAMYEAKRSRAGALVYDHERDGQARSRLALAEALRGAITDGQLVLHYQPKLDITRNAVVGWRRWCAGGTRPGGSSTRTRSSSWPSRPV
jgi:diguanylate cyclase (GGDEF)-like protein